MAFGHVDMVEEVQRARQGDPEAWNLLFARYQLPLFAYVRELLGNTQASLDVIQESFMNATRHLPGLKADDKFASWLFGIAHQKCIQHWRKAASHPITSLPEDEVIELPSNAPGPDDVLASKEHQARFYERLDQLPESHKTVLLLHYLEDFSLEDIAAITGQHLGTVKSRLHYARKAMRQSLETQPL